MLTRLKREGVARLFAVVTLALVIGAVVLLLELLLRLVQGQGLPKWSATTYLSAAFGLGVAYLVAEILWGPIGRVLVDQDKVSDPLWKRSLRLLVLIGIVGMFVAAGIILTERGW